MQWEWNGNRNGMVFATRSSTCWIPVASQSSSLFETICWSWTQLPHAFLPPPHVRWCTRRYGGAFLVFAQEVLQNFSTSGKVEQGGASWPARSRQFGEMQSIRGLHKERGTDWSYQHLRNSKGLSSHTNLQPWHFGILPFFTSIPFPAGTGNGNSNRNPNWNSNWNSD